MNTYGSFCEARIIGKFATMKMFWQSDRAFYLLLVLIIITILGWGVYVWDYWIEFMALKGQYGDAFGVLTSLFTAISFVFFLRALRFQRLQLEEQRKDLMATHKMMELQKNEMEQSNAIFESQKTAIQIQQSEGTFFKLIDSHSEMVKTITIGKYNNYHGLNKAQEIFSRRLSIYKECVSAGGFDDISRTCYHPLHIYHEFPSLRNVLESISHIVEWIIQKLNNDPIYHKTLFNRLNPAERFILGMAIKNKLIDFPEVWNFSYEKEFVEKSEYINRERDGFFPCVDYSFDNYEHTFSVVKDEIEQTETEFKFTIFWNKVFSDEKVTFKGFNLEYTVPESKERRKVALDNNIAMQSRTDVNFYSLVRSNIIEEYLNWFYQGNSNYFQLSFMFKFEFEGKPFTAAIKEMTMRFIREKGNQIIIGLYPTPSH